MDDTTKPTTEADTPPKETNDARRQNTYSRTTINTKHSTTSILENELKELNNYSNNVLLSEQEKMKKELLIKRRINYMLMKNNQAKIFSQIVK